MRHSCGLAHSAPPAPIYGPQPASPFLIQFHHSLPNGLRGFVPFQSRRSSFRREGLIPEGLVWRAEVGSDFGCLLRLHKPVLLNGIIRDAQSSLYAHCLPAGVLWDLLLSSALSVPDLPRCSPAEGSLRSAGSECVVLRLARAL